MLTTGSWKSIMNNEDINKSIMQVLSIKMITDCWGKERYCLLFSDCDNSYSFVMLAFQLNNLVITGILSNFAIVWITEHIISKFSPFGISAIVMIVFKLVVLVSGVFVDLKIGNPKPIINSKNEIYTLNSSAIINENHLLSKCFDILPI